MDNSQVTITLTSLDRSEEPSVRRFTLTPTSRSIDIGRSSGSRSKGITAAEDNAWFNNPVMSRRHGTLFIKPGSQHLYIRDLGSMHGTTLNGKIVQLNKEYKIENRDVIKFGNNILRGEVSFPARAYDIRYNWNPIIKRTGTSTFTVPDGNSSSDVDSISESSEDDQSRNAKASTSVSIRGLLANRKLNMGSRVASVVGVDALQPPQKTKAAPEVGSSQQNPVELDEDDTNHTQRSSATKVIPDSVIDIISDTGDSTGRKHATASKEFRLQAQPLTPDAANGASEPEPTMKPKITDGNANVVPEEWSQKESSPDSCFGPPSIQDYESVPPVNHPDEDESELDDNEKCKEFEQALKEKDFGDQVDEGFGLGCNLVNGKQRQDKPMPLLSAAKDLRPSFSDTYSRSYHREASLEKVAQDLHEVICGYTETYGKPKDYSLPVPISTVPDSMQLNPTTSQADRASKAGYSSNPTIVPDHYTPEYRPEPQRKGYQRDRPNYHSVTFAEDPLVHEPPLFSPPRPWDMNYVMTEAPWSANLSSNYWDPVRGLHCEDWLAGQNPVMTQSQSMSSSRPLQVHGSQFIPSSTACNTSAEPSYFLPTSKIQWDTEATFTEGFAPSVSKASQIDHDTLDKAAPGKSKQPNSHQDTRKSPIFRSPRKNGMSILDILDPNGSKAMASAAGTKRKLAEITTEPTSANAARLGETAKTVTAPCAEASSDQQHQEPLVTLNARIDTDASDASAHAQEPVPKRARWQFAAAAATGALVGSLGMLVTLVNLPESLFQ